MRRCADASILDVVRSLVRTTPVPILTGARSEHYEELQKTTELEMEEELVMEGAKGLQKLPMIRNRYFLALDLVLVPIAAIISFLLRLDPSGWQLYAYTTLVYAALALTIKPGVYFLFGLYRRYWRYAGSRELVIIMFATLVATMVTICNSAISPRMRYVVP